MVIILNLLMLIIVILLLLIGSLLKKIKELKENNLDYSEEYKELKIYKDKYEEYKKGYKKEYKQKYENCLKKLNKIYKQYSILRKLIKYISLKRLIRDFTTIGNIVSKHKGVLEDDRWGYKIPLTFIDLFVSMWFITKRNIKLKWKKWKSLRISMTKKWKEFRKKLLENKEFDFYV